MRSGAVARTIGPVIRLSLEPDDGGSRCDRRSGDPAGQPSTLLLGHAAPDAVALAVLQGPGETLLADPARSAVRERGPGLLLGDREEHVGIDAEAGGAVLP